MAILQTDVARLIEQAASGNDSIRLSGNRVCGNLLMARATYTVSAGVALNDVIKIVRLPKGAILVPSLCSLYTECLGSVFEIFVGNFKYDDCYSDALAMNVSGHKPLNGASMLVGIYENDVIQNDWITAVITKLTAPNIGRCATFWIAYIQP